MKVKVIGSGTSWTERPTSSYCIDNHILVDCGDGTTKMYNKSGIDLEKIDTVFITHLHTDHMGGLTLFVCYLLRFELSQRKKFTIYGPVGILEILQIMQKYFVRDPKNRILTDYINVVEIADFNQTLKVEDYNVTMTELKHGTILDIGYTFDNGTKKVSFSGDCTYNENLEKFIQKSDVIFLDCSNIETTENHLGIDNFVKLQQKYINKRFIAIHCVDNIYFNANRYGIEVNNTGDEYNF